MSNVTTILEKAIVTADRADFTKFEDRIPKAGIFDAFRRDTELLVDPAMIMALKTSTRRPVQIPALKRSLYRVGTKREISPAVDSTSSDLVNIPWQTREFAFTLSNALAEDNIFGAVQEFQRNMFNGIMSVMFDHPTNSIERMLYTYLAANTWAAPPASAVPGVTVSGGAYNILTSDYSVDAPVVLKELNISGRLMDISSVSSLSRRRKEGMYGANNEHNQAQYDGQMDYFTSPMVTSAVDTLGTHFLVEGGSLGLLTYVESDARNNRTDKDGRFQTIQDPFFGLEWGVYITEARSDRSATHGLGSERVIGTQYHFALDFAAIRAYSSKVGESPIVKVNELAPPVVTIP